MTQVTKEKKQTNMRPQVLTKPFVCTAPSADSGTADRDHRVECEVPFSSRASDAPALLALVRQSRRRGLHGLARR